MPAPGVRTVVNTAFTERTLLQVECGDALNDLYFVVLMFFQ